MRLVPVPLFLMCVAAFAPRASATVINFGPTNQNITFTGLGVTAGQPQVRVTWGACAFNGTNTVCTVTAPFTGLGGGGTVSWVLTYQGNGPSPLTAAFASPGSETFVLSVTGSSFVSFVQTLAESNGTSPVFYYTNLTFNFNQPQCAGVSMCTPGQVGITANATITGSISGTSDVTPIIRIPQGVISASGFGAFNAIAPGTWIEIYGTNLATSQSRTWGSADFSGNNAPTALAGTTVSIGGQAAFIDFVNPGQVNAQVPSGVATGQQAVVVTTAGGASAPYTVQVNATQPGLLAPSVFQLSGGLQYVVALFPDGFTYVLPPGVTTAVPTRRAKPGDTIVLYGIGFGPVTPNIPAGQIVQQSNTLQSALKVFFGGTPATVSYYGLTPTYVGLYQFNVVVPNVAASDAVPLTFTLGSSTGTQTLVIPIGN